MVWFIIHYVKSEQEKALPMKIVLSFGLGFAPLVIPIACFIMLKNYLKEKINDIR